ncbi:hypothetical protein DUNSADRAFT_2260 [Dunaliella salina]|uniref:3CxxC-type domain-containing protein n=1 Tax=Dunaliella salina TaxID=3046 RepID=A0ABQ7FWI0_DUNSA|nr:hypothetical protein DUNSADRAFT_2260 [Dunaliella salina]|eukprot:KAF5826726.1 hypothetical protein DUNSADRAFT_2260 [Dunaliella salina]
MNQKQYRLKVNWGKKTAALTHRSSGFELSMGAKKFYAVREGRQKGVWESWASVQPLVSGFAGCVFKSFPSKEEAEAFVRGDSQGGAGAPKPTRFFGIRYPSNVAGVYQSWEVVKPLVHEVSGSVFKGGFATAEDAVKWVQEVVQMVVHPPQAPAPARHPRELRSQRGLADAGRDQQSLVRQGPAADEHSQQQHGIASNSQGQSKSSGTTGDGEGSGTDCGMEEEESSEELSEEEEEEEEEEEVEEEEEEACGTKGSCNDEDSGEGGPYRQGNDDEQEGGVNEEEYEQAGQGSKRQKVTNTAAGEQKAGNATGFLGGGLGLTPYQGTNRMFGHFRCTCGRRWFSGNSWADYGQDCEACGKNIYPHTQTPLLKSKNPSDPEKPHPQELCGKCRALGRHCRTIWVSNLEPW